MEYIIENCKSFRVNHIFDCGQCFRWNKQIDGSYIGVFGNNVFKVKEEIENNKLLNKKDTYKITITGTCEDDIEKICKQYFDLDRNYDEIEDRLSRVDDNLKKSIQYGSGIRILNQDLWEMIISFIISANNNIPRIKGIIDRISKKYGSKIEFEGNDYYTFPSPEELSKASIEDLRALGLGFRDKYVYETTKKVLNKTVDLNKLVKEKDTKKIRNELLTLPGVGPKVADCIMLFSTLKRLDVFPIDVWVRRVMNNLYIHEENETKVNKKQIANIAKEKFGDLQGIAQQYLFYWKREN